MIHNRSFMFMYDSYDIYIYTCLYTYVCRCPRYALPAGVCGVTFEPVCKFSECWLCCPWPFARRYCWFLVATHDAGVCACTCLYWERERADKYMDTFMDWSKHTQHKDICIICIDVHAYIYKHAHTHTHTNIHAYIHTHTHTHMHANVTRHCDALQHTTTHCA